MQEGFSFCRLGISIHALQAECDPHRSHWECEPSYFYPRTPSGVRQFVTSLKTKVLLFLSTHSKRSATIEGAGDLSGFYISIHALQAECDNQELITFAHEFNFYPRTPSGVRLTPFFIGHITFNFYPRTPSGVRLNALKCYNDRLNFYPRTPSGVRHKCIIF